MKSTITILLILLFYGCGSRKAEIDKQKVEVKELKEIVLKLKNDIQSNVHLTKVAKRTIVEPIDTTKESTFNGTLFKNARITQEEEITDSTAYLNDKSEKDIKVVDKKETDVKTKEKDTESKKGNIWLYLIIGLVVVFGISIYARSNRWV